MPLLHSLLFAWDRKFVIGCRVSELRFNCYCPDSRSCSPCHFSSCGPFPALRGVCIFAPQLFTLDLSASRPNSNATSNLMLWVVTKVLFFYVFICFYTYISKLFLCVCYCLLFAGIWKPAFNVRHIFILIHVWPPNTFIKNSWNIFLKNLNKRCKQQLQNSPKFPWYFSWFHLLKKKKKSKMHVMKHQNLRRIARRNCSSPLLIDLAESRETKRQFSS